MVLKTISPGCGVRASLMLFSDLMQSGLLEYLTMGAQQFEKSAVRMKRKYFWQNAKVLRCYTRLTF